MAETYVFYHLTRPAAVLRATGPDAFAFLQSQFSNDLKNPGIELSVTYGLWLDHKGKIQADSFVLEKTHENFLLLSYDCPATLLRGQLESRLVADEVTLADETEKFCLLHLWPAEPDADLSELVDRVADPAVCESWMGRRPSSFGSWDILVPPAAAEKIIAELSSLGAAACSAEDLHGLRVVAGVPAVPQDAGPGDLPQEARLEGAAVSFEKGCFVGQEIMSRLHSQGHVNRGLWQVAWEFPQQWPSATEPVPLFAGEVPAGELRSRVTKDGESIGLAMLKQRAVAGLKSLSFSPNGPKAVLLVRDLTAG